MQCGGLYSGTHFQNLTQENGTSMPVEERRLPERSIDSGKKKCFLAGSTINMERVMGIEPTQSAWEADILPLNYTRTKISLE